MGNWRIGNYLFAFTVGSIAALADYLLDGHGTFGTFEFFFFATLIAREADDIKDLIKELKQNPNQ